jgi:hypothetical protein
MQPIAENADLVKPPQQPWRAFLLLGALTAGWPTLADITIPPGGAGRGQFARSKFDRRNVAVARDAEALRSPKT